MSDNSPLILAIITGLTMGQLAILHCFGMCGPLHLMVCTHNRTRPTSSMLLFNSGRVLGYTTAGGILGVIGSYFEFLQHECCHQAMGKINYGVLLSALMMFYMSYRAFRKVKSTKITALFWQRFLRVDKRLPLALGGFLTALMPCHILYLAYAAAVVSGKFTLGCVILLSFALPQTFCMQAGVVLGKLIHSKYENLFERLFPWLALGLGSFYSFLVVSKLH
ncbi:MAG: hypothetical protein A2X86_00315 [Bdellovibrionales bacterium GWA2_49_15]|nr:MAG: hypothetical protein A2X86_00315 [Bdellovibrionales bacterium GWA2_49_15]HAZ14486.1 hypothetical protein [Bdellovibrionales bacterium]